MTKSFSINFSFNTYAVRFNLFFVVVFSSFVSASCFTFGVCNIFFNAFLSINCDARFYEFNGPNERKRGIANNK